MRRLLLSCLFSMAASVSFAGADQRPLLSTPQQDQFFSAVSALCGKAFEGQLATEGSPDFAGKRLVMHVRKCTDQSLEIPFHVGDDASRTWVITKTGSGLQLKHDHRHKDGTSDTLTMYGGHTQDAGYAHAQSFAADAPTQQMFVEQKIPRSNGNTWQFFVYDDQFTYRLVRDGLEFTVNFDLTTEVELPQTPWGYSDD